MKYTNSTKSLRFSKSIVAIFAVSLTVWLSGCSIEKGARKSSRTSAKVESGVEADYKKALAQIQAKRYDEAEQTLLGLTRAQANLAGPYANLGVVYFQTEKFDAASEAFEKSLTLNPNNAAAQNYLGVIHRTNGDFPKARAAYLKALEIDPSYAEAHLNLGILYDLYLNDPNQALIHFKQYQSMAGQNDKQIAIWIADVEQRSQQDLQKGKAEAQ